MPDEYTPLEIDLDTIGTTEGIIAILQSTIDGIKSLKEKVHLRKIHLTMKLVV